MIKVAYLISSLANEGPTRVLLNIVRHLDRKRFTPVILTLVEERSPSLLSDFEQLKVRVIKLSDRASGTIARASSLHQVLSSENFNIVHAHCPRSLFFMRICVPKKMRTAYTVHCYPRTQFKVIHGPIKGAIITATSNMAIRFIDKPIACSDSVAAEYLEKNNFEMASVNNGIEEMGSSLTGAREAKLRSLGLNPARKHLLFVGRLSAEKQISQFTRTFGEANLPDVDLVIVGKGVEETKIRSLANDNVHLLGFHSDVRPYLEACDYYVSPSATEGLANSLLEAMSKGMLSILSRIPSHEYVFRKCDGYIGELVDPLSAAEFAAAFIRLQQQDTEQVRDNVRNNFLNHFHASAMTRGYERIYDDLV